MDVFNSRFSIIKFITDTIATPYSLALFCNDPKLPRDEQAMADADHYLYLELYESEYEIIQPYDIILSLYATPAFDPTANWLRRMGYVITHLIVQTKSDATLNLVAMYDYDTLIGASNITTFLTTGAYPSNIVTLLATQPPTLTKYTPSDIDVGFLVVPDRRAPVIRTDTTPYEMTWHMTFKFHEPLHNP
jgi:hypothetical protein